MKKLVQKFGNQTLMFALIFLIFASCSKDDTPKDETPNPSTNPDGIEQDSVVVGTEDSLIWEAK